MAIPFDGIVEVGNMPSAFDDRKLRVLDAALHVEGAPMSGVFGSGDYQAGLIDTIVDGLRLGFFERPKDLADAAHAALNS